MAAATLEQILFYRNLTGVIRLIKSGIPNALPAEYMSVGKKVPGNRAEYYRITGTRKLARMVQFGAPALRRELRNVDLVPVTLFHAFESQQWPLALTLMMSEMKELKRDELGKEQAEYQSQEFKQHFANLRIALTAQALFSGIVYIDSNGNMQPGASGSSYNVNYGVPAGNQNQLNVLGTGNIISASWATTTTNIVTQLINLRTAAGKLTGYPIEVAFYGDNIPEYIGANATAQQYLKLNPPMNQAFINDNSAVPNGFGGVKRWIHAGNMFYDDKNGTHQNLLGANQVIFCPPHSPEWFDTFEGSFPMPQSVLPVMGGTTGTVLDNVVAEYGMFSYGMLGLNPPTVEQFAGDTFLPILKVPSAVFQATVAGF